MFWYYNVKLASDSAIKSGILMHRDCLKFKTYKDEKYLGFEIGKHSEYFSLGANKWCLNHVSETVAMLNFRKWAWSESHIYYDGPHCSRSFGWLEFFWCNWNCKKCKDD